MKILSALFLVCSASVTLALPWYWCWPQYFELGLTINIITIIAGLAMFSVCIDHLDKEEPDVVIPKTLSTLCRFYINFLITIFMVWVIFVLYKNISFKWNTFSQIFVGSITLITYLFLHLLSIFNIFKRNDR